MDFHPNGIPLNTSKKKKSSAQSTKLHSSTGHHFCQPPTDGISDCARSAQPPPGSCAFGFCQPGCVGDGRASLKMSLGEQPLDLCVGKPNKSCRGGQLCQEAADPSVGVLLKQPCVLQRKQNNLVPGATHPPRQPFVQPPNNQDSISWSWSFKGTRQQSSGWLVILRLK